MASLWKKFLSADSAVSVKDRLEPSSSIITVLIMEAPLLTIFLLTSAIFPLGTEIMVPALNIAVLSAVKKSSSCLITAFS